MQGEIYRPQFIFPSVYQTINFNHKTLIMKSFKKVTQVILVVCTLAFLITGCEKDAHIPPSVTLKTGTGYTFADGSAARNTAVLVGITADKKEDDMRTYNVSYAYDGAATTVTSQTFSLAGAEQQHYEKDVTFTTRNQAGTEKWVFTITDKDGNISQKQVVLTVP